MKPGSPEWIQESLAKLERLESARDALQNMLSAADDPQEEAAQSHALAQLEDQIAALYQELEQVAAADEDEGNDEDFDPAADSSFTAGAQLSPNIAQAIHEEIGHARPAAQPAARAAAKAPTIDFDDEEPAPRRGLFGRKNFAAVDDDDDLIETQANRDFDDRGFDNQAADDSGPRFVETAERERDSTLAFRPAPLASTKSSRASAAIPAAASHRSDDFDADDPFSAPRPRTHAHSNEAATRPYSTTQAPYYGGDDDSDGDGEYGRGDASSFPTAVDYDYPEPTSSGGGSKMWLGVAALVAVLGAGGFFALRGNTGGQADATKAAGISAPAGVPAGPVQVIEAVPIPADTEGPPPSAPGTTVERTPSQAEIDKARAKAVKAAPAPTPARAQKSKSGGKKSAPATPSSKKIKFDSNADPLG